MNKYKEGIDWQFVNPDGYSFEDAPVTAIGLLMDEYKGVLYHYHKARVVEEGEGAKLQFGYTILQSGQHDIDNLMKDDNFIEVMGDILSDIIVTQQQSEQSKVTNFMK
jgi:hypothetical protein